MAFLTDDLEKNPFYIALETKYADKFKEAQSKIWLICVPFHKSIKGQNISKEFIEAHILKPSPFFKSHFVPTDGNSSSTYEIADDSLKSNAGVAIRILSEETAYNKDFKPYRILTIERPLCCFSDEKNLVSYDDNSKRDIRVSFQECSMFLMSFPECREVIKMLDKKIQVFNSSYMILPHYLRDASAKLQSLLKWTEEEFERFLKYRTSDEYSKTDTCAALENYVLFRVHDKVFPAIKKFCSEEDLKLTEKLLLLYEAHVTPDQLGAKEIFCCQTPSAIVELASLNSRKSPVEKLNCLMNTLELLNEDIEQFLNDSCYPVSTKDAPYLTSDDLIPLLVYVIIQARPQYLVSNLHYIQNFCWENSPTDKLSFGLVTFQAAKEFLKSYEFKHLKPSLKKIKKEISLEELMEVTVEMQNSKKISLMVQPPHLPTPTDHLLENVTKMIEASTSDLREGSHKNEPSSPFGIRPQENVGDFLSNLRQSSLGLTYGKQT